MLAKFENRFEKLDKSLEEAFAFLDNKTPGARHNAPDGKWNAIQILVHLYTAEKGITAYLKKKIQAPLEEIPKAGLSSKVRSFMLNRALNNDAKKFKAPKGLSDKPEQMDYTQLKTSYRATRDELKQVAESFDKKMAGRAYFKHPRAGRLSLGQTLKFMEIHFDRHRRQIDERVG